MRVERGKREILINVRVVVIICGERKIPELMKGIGKGGKSFRDGMNGVEDEQDKQDKQDKSADQTKEDDSTK